MFVYLIIIPIFLFVLCMSVGSSLTGTEVLAGPKKLRKFNEI